MDNIDFNELDQKSMNMLFARLLNAKLCLLIVKIRFSDSLSEFESEIEEKVSSMIRLVDSRVLEPNKETIDELYKELNYELIDSAKADFDSCCIYYMFTLCAAAFHYNRSDFQKHFKSLLECFNKMLNAVYCHTITEEQFIEFDNLVAYDELYNGSDAEVLTSKLRSFLEAQHFVF